MRNGDADELGIVAMLGVPKRVHRRLWRQASQQVFRHDMSWDEFLSLLQLGLERPVVVEAELRASQPMLGGPGSTRGLRVPTPAPALPTLDTQATDREAMLELLKIWCVDAIREHNAAQRHNGRRWMSEAEIAWYVPTRGEIARARGSSEARLSTYVNAYGIGLRDALKLVLPRARRTIVEELRQDGAIFEVA
jgi:hypothetical protein